MSDAVSGSGLTIAVVAGLAVFAAAAKRPAEGARAGTRTDVHVPAPANRRSLRRRG